MKNKKLTTIYNSITPQEAKKLMLKESKLIIIDVRTEKEFLYEGRLKNSISIDYQKPRLFKKEIKKFDTKLKYIIYSATGNTSKCASNDMIDLGFENIYEMKNGLKSWQQDINLVCPTSKLDSIKTIETKKNIITRLNKIEGQVLGIKKMVMNKRYIGDILNQSLAVKLALNSANQEVMEMFSDDCIKSLEAKNDFLKYLKRLI